MGSFMSCCEGDGQHPLEVFVIDSKKKKKKEKGGRGVEEFLCTSRGSPTHCLSEP